MKNIWTPWRVEYVSGGDRGKGCIFEAGDGMNHDRKSLLLYRDATVAVFLNRFPYANGHLLIAPVRHVGDIVDLSEAENVMLLKMVGNSVTILRRQMNPDGFNIGLNIGTIAGAGHPEHLHFHVVPRWNGDHNFMTVLAEVRTIPEHIDSTFDRLLSDFQELLINNLENTTS
jgi:ATP adenylyltransferase